MNLTQISPFLTGTITTLGIDTAAVSNGFVDISNIDVNNSTIVSLVGGILATVLLNVLKAKFPKLFKPIKSKS